jgi:hypothetical protein
MNRRPNRVVLVLVAVVLLALGLVPLLVGAGLLPLREPADLYGEMVAGAQAFPWAWALGVVLGGILLAALGAWLVRRQLRIRRGGRLDTVVVQRTDRGRTTLKAVSAAQAAAADLSSRKPILDSNVRMVTFGDRPRLIVDLDVPAEGDPRRALQAAEDAYGRLATALGVEAVHVDTQVHPTGSGRASRVD